LGVLGFQFRFGSLVCVEHFEEYRQIVNGAFGGGEIFRPAFFLFYFP
jgi:hypothetical protein